MSDVCAASRLGRSRAHYLRACEKVPLARRDYTI
jgi:hypothetical protein